MTNLSIQSKEELIVGTILSCNNEIKKFSKLTGLKESNKVSLYHFNMIQLFGQINPLFENNFEINNIPDSSIYIKNKRDNFYSYFQKVNEFLDGYEPNIQKSLNENLNIDESIVENPLQINIDTFKKDLKKIIDELSIKNDLDKIPKEILKIKLLAKKPIFIYGFDICNNIALQKELFENFKLQITDLLSICFDKTNKQLLFVTTNTNTIVCYDLENDIFDLYNNVNKDSKIKSEQLKSKNYLEILKELIHNNIIEIYINIDKFDLKYVNNLYSDELRIAENKKLETEKSLIKK